MAQNITAATLGQARIHWITYRWPLIWLVFAVVLLGGEEYLAAPGIIVLSAFLFAKAALRSRGSDLVLTEDNVILHKGIITKSMTELDMRQVEAVRVHQGLFGRWWNFGTITITGTGGVRLTLDEVSDPENFKALVLNKVTSSK